MRYIFRGHIVFEYKPDDKFDKVVQGKIHDAIPALDFCHGILEGKEKLKQFFKEDFEKHEMVCIVENIFEDGNVGILEWKDPKGLRGCGFFWFDNDKIVYQRGYWDRLSFMEQQQK